MKFVHATGGGAYKYSGIVKERLNVDFKQLDEMRCMISALNFLVLETNNEIFTYRDGVQVPSSLSSLPLPPPRHLLHVFLFPGISKYVQGIGVSLPPVIMR